MVHNLRPCQDLVIELWSSTYKKITVYKEHVQGQKNVETNAESRGLLDQSDWMLNQEMFQVLKAKT